MKTIHSSKLIFFIVIISALFFSCSTAKLATEDLQHIKTLSPDSTKALVYIVRPSLYGTAITFGVTCNGNRIGATNGQRFIYTFLEPGIHTFISKAENKSELILKVEPGKTYFINQKAKMGLLFARVGMEVVDEMAGRSLLAKCKLSGDCVAHKG